MSPVGTTDQPFEIALGARNVLVDRRRRVVVVRERHFLLWWRTVETVRLDHMSHLEFKLHASHLEAAVGDALLGARKGGSVEHYRILLVLKDGREIELADVSGRSYATHHDDAARQILRVLERALGLELGPKLKVNWDPGGRRYNCEACGHDVPPNARRCLYCGGAVGAAQTEWVIE